MSNPALIGIGVTVLCVIGAYWMGYSNGFAAGEGRGFDDGKREGAKEGSMRGYAVGFDRGRNRRDDSSPSSRSHLRLGVIGLLIATVAIFYLAAHGRSSPLRSDERSPRRIEPQTDRPAHATSVWPADEPATSESSRGWSTESSERE